MGALKLPRWSLWPCIALGLALAAVWTIPTPAPRGANGPPSQFSAARAFPIIQQLAAAPHPIGSLEHARVRDGLLARMALLGLRPDVQRGIGIERGRYAGGDVAAGQVENLFGVLPGTNRAAPAVLLMAHYDSVPLSPGAADDMTGVASLLETVRALKADGPHRRDVIVAITDGEEEGLLGAELFFRENPLAGRAGVVINAEARGDAGRVAMFQTGPGDGEMVRLFARAAERPFGNSVTGFVYALLPNDTDFTHVVRRGTPGLNFAFIGDQLAYHTAVSTPAHLDRGSLQHMGMQILGVTRALADAPVLPRRTADVAYSDIAPGLPMLVYPFWAGWIVIAVAALLLTAGALAGRDRPGLWSMAGGVGVAFGATALAGLALFATGLAIGAGMSSDVQLYRLLGPYTPLFAGEALIAFGAVLGVYRLARGLNPRAAWIGAVKLGLALAIAVQVLAPPAAILFAWPALAGALSLVIGRFGGRIGAVASAAVAVLMLAILSAWATQLYAALGPPMPVLLTLFVPLLLPSFAPFATLWSRSPVAGWSGSAVLAIGAAVVAFAVIAPPTATRPAVADLDFLADPATGRYAWLVRDSRLGSWTRAVLARGTGPIAHGPKPPLFERAVWSAIARPVAVAPPEVQAVHTTAGTHIAVRAVGGGRELILFLRLPTGLTGGTLGGVTVRLRAKPGAWARVVFGNPGAEPMTLDLPPGPAPEIIATEVRDGWPVGASPPKRPGNLMPSAGSDLTFVIGRPSSVR